MIRRTSLISEEDNCKENNTSDIDKEETRPILTWYQNCGIYKLIWYDGIKYQFIINLVV